MMNAQRVAAAARRFARAARDYPGDADLLFTPAELRALLNVFNGRETGAVVILLVGPDEVGVLERAAERLAKAAADRARGGH